MRLAHFFIERPRFATVLSAFVTLLGLGALAILPVAQYPEIVPPTVQITTVYPGASADTVSRTVATPLEQQINGVKNMLARLEGGGDVQFQGGREYAMRIWLEPDKVAANNLNGSEVLAALRAQNLQVSAGILNQPPASGHEAYQINVEALGRLSTPEQFGDIVVKSDKQGRVTRVRDIGRVEVGAADYGSTAYMDRSDATALVIYAQPCATPLALEHELLSPMKDLKREFPQGVDYKIIYDPTTFIAKSVREVVITIFIAVLLVLCVVFLFLHNWRASIIPVIAIPVFLVGTCAVVYALGIS